MKSILSKKSSGRLVMSVGYSCNNNCKFCVVADKRAHCDKTTDQIKLELCEAYKNGFKEVVFTGGEYTIRKDVFELIEYAKNLGYLVIQIQTNGRRFSSKDFCEKIFIAGMNQFAPSLHGHTPDLHDKLTQKTGSFRQTVLGIYNIKKLTKGRVRIFTNTVVTKHNYVFLPKIAELLIKLGVDMYQFAFIHPQGQAQANFNDLVPKKTDALPYIKKGLDLGIANGVGVMTEALALCLLPGYEQYCGEFYSPDNTQLRERGVVINDFDSIKIKLGKVKFKQCNLCKFNNLCQGPWKEYAEYYGDSEFKPIMN
jgi:MoaA/NifB/PqqE/SkfB family radical SAM enzyme